MIRHILIRQFSSFFKKALQSVTLISCLLFIVVSLSCSSSGHGSNKNQELNQLIQKYFNSELQDAYYFLLINPNTSSEQNEKLADWVDSPGNNQRLLEHNTLFVFPNLREVEINAYFREIIKQSDLKFKVLTNADLLKSLQNAYCNSPSDNGNFVIKMTTENSSIKTWSF